MNIGLLYNRTFTPKRVFLSISLPLSFRVSHRKWWSFELNPALFLRNKNRKIDIQASPPSINNNDHNDAVNRQKRMCRDARKSPLTNHLSLVAFKNGIVWFR